MCEEMKIYDYLKSKDIYTEVSGQVIDGIKFYIVSIEWGDWKHDHIYCDILMKDFGYCKLKETVTEEDGSDCYSAEHFYVKSEIVADPE